MIISRVSRALGSVRHPNILSSHVHKRSASISQVIDESPVLVSANKDVFTNLALEHWLYTNLTYNDPKQQGQHQDSLDHRIFDKPTVLIWTDEPCIVIGRHQNPWVETTLGLVNKLGIKLARRHSGGGCVYHDDSNINISIIGHRNLFENRQANLRFLAQVLKENYGIECEPNKRHDLIHSATGLKLSGSAAKLGRANCYHHFTLLVDTDKEIMQALIRQKQQDFIKTNSSLSTRSSVINLKEIEPDLTVERVVSDLSQAYNKHYSHSEVKRNSSKKARLEGNQDEFEQLNKFKLELESPKWIYGMTPRFVLEQSLDLLDGGIKKEAKMTVHVNHGEFESIQIECDLRSGNPSDKFQSLVGTKFSYKDSMVNTVKTLGLDKLDTQTDGQLILPNASEQILGTLLLKIIHDAHF